MRLYSKTIQIQKTSVLPVLFLLCQRFTGKICLIKCMHILNQYCAKKQRIFGEVCNILGRSGVIAISFRQWKQRQVKPVSLYSGLYINSFLKKSKPVLDTNLGKPMFVKKIIENNMFRQIKENILIYHKVSIKPVCF